MCHEVNRSDLNRAKRGCLYVKRTVEWEGEFIMGQPIDAEMRQLLLDMPDVAFVTNDHIGFRDGCISRPAVYFG